MKRILFAAVCAAVLFFCTSCAGLRPETPARDDFRLGEGIEIAGVEVSGLTVGEARSRVLQKERARFADTTLTLLCAGNTRQVALSDLMLTGDLEAVLQQAAHLPLYNGIGRENRQLPLTWQLAKGQGTVLALEAAACFEKAPQNAKALRDPDAPQAFSFVPEQTGVQVDVPTLCELLSSGWQNGSLSVPCAPVAAAYTLAQAEAEHRLIAGFTTSFHRSPYNAAGRVHNIKKAAALLDGVVIAPGEELNMNRVLGDRTGENGWKKAPGIREGKYEQEYGGGVCQVSTTLFNAAMMADLTITERHPHSWPLGYIGIGMDATISTGGPNLRIQNNSAAPVTVVTRVDEEKDTVTVELYGLPLPDGMTIRIASRQTGTLPEPAAEYVSDDSLQPGQRVVDREGRSGKTSVTYKLYYDEAGNLLKKTVAHEDRYRPIAKRVLVGIAHSAAAST